MALGFGSYARMEALLLKTRNILGEGNDVFKEANKAQALQYAADHYNLYGGDGSETTYTDIAGLTIKQAQMIAAKAAVQLTISAISYYKEDVIHAQAGPASAQFRPDKLAWLKEALDELKDLLKDAEASNGLLTGVEGLTGLQLGKGLACCDPPEDICPEVKANWGNGEAGI
jgi:hypothetical protein